MFKNINVNNMQFYFCRIRFLQTFNALLIGFHVLNNNVFYIFWLFGKSIVFNTKSTVSRVPGGYDFFVVRFLVTIAYNADDEHTVKCFYIYNSSTITRTNTVVQGSATFFVSRAKK